jgi:hypothetical protein
MLSKLDATLLVAWLASGALALESHARVDIAVPDRVATAKPMTCQVERGPRPSRTFGFDVLEATAQGDFDVAIVDIAVRCEPI